MIIHSYLTNGFYPWAKIFIKSFRLHNGSNVKIVLTTRDLNEKQVNTLVGMEENIEVRNAPLDWQRMSDLSGVPIKQLKGFKKQVEEKHVTPASVIWKQFISVEDRYRNSIKEIMDDYREEDFLLHSDIDMYVRGSLDKLFSLIMSNDVSVRFRLNSADNRKVLGNLIGFKLGGKCDKFMERWIHHIDAIPIKEKPIGYGQTSFYYAYLGTKDIYSWGDIPAKFTSPKMAKNAVVWAANNSKGKTHNLKVCREDMKKAREKLQRAKQKNNKKVSSESYTTEARKNKK